MRKKLRNYIPVVKRVLKKKLIRMISAVLADDPYVRNCFHSSYTKRVLLVYVPEPFQSSAGISRRHTNLTECYTAGKIFHQLGYRVDCISLDSERKICYADYHVIYGMGSAFEASFLNTQAPVTRIFYATGTNAMRNNIATVLKLRAVYEEKQVWMTTSSRYPDGRFLAWLLSDHVIALGNERVRKSYEDDDDRKDRYSNLNAFYFKSHTPRWEEKDFKAAQKHFLWFGSTGLVHKGLDICLDIFLKRRDLCLHICGAPRKEREFWNYYGKLVGEATNIFNHGFIDVDSEKFARILHTCGTVLFPSVAEGGAPSLLNVIANGGLLPVYSRSSGVDLPEEGLELTGQMPELYEKAIEKVLAMPAEELKQRSMRVYQQVIQEYSLENYEKNLKNIILSVVEKTNPSVL